MRENILLGSSVLGIVPDHDLVPDFECKRLVILGHQRMQGHNSVVVAVRVTSYAHAPTVGKVRHQGGRDRLAADTVEFLAVLVFPSPKFHCHEDGVPVEVSRKAIV